MGLPARSIPQLSQMALIAASNSATSEN